MIGLCKYTYYISHVSKENIKTTSYGIRLKRINMKNRYKKIINKKCFFDRTCFFQHVDYKNLNKLYHNLKEKIELNKKNIDIIYIPEYNIYKYILQYKKEIQLLIKTNKNLKQIKIQNYLFVLHKVQLTGYNNCNIKRYKKFYNCISIKNYKKNNYIKEREYFECSLLKTIQIQESFFHFQNISNINLKIYIIIQCLYSDIFLENLTNLYSTIIYHFIIFVKKGIIRRKFNMSYSNRLVRKSRIKYPILRKSIVENTHKFIIPFHVEMLKLLINRHHIYISKLLQIKYFDKYFSLVISWIENGLKPTESSFLFELLHKHTFNHNFFRITPYKKILYEAMILNLNQFLKKQISILKDDISYRRLILIKNKLLLKNKINEKIVNNKNKESNFNKILKYIDNKNFKSKIYSIFKLKKKIYREIDKSIYNISKILNIKILQQLLKLIPRVNEKIL